MWSMDVDVGIESTDKVPVGPTDDRQDGWSLEGLSVICISCGLYIRSSQPLSQPLKLVLQTETF